jgi:hypothetical protein
MLLRSIGVWLGTVSLPDKSSMSKGASLNSSLVVPLVYTQATRASCRESSAQRYVVEFHSELGKICCMHEI